MKGIKRTSAVTDYEVGDDASVRIEGMEKDPRIFLVSMMVGSRVFRGVLMDSCSVDGVRAQQEAEIRLRTKLIPSELVSVEMKSWDDHVAGLTRRRGRKAAWTAQHPEDGPCTTCRVCHNSGPTSSFTHPALWRNAPPEWSTEFNLRPESCVCHHCYSTRIKKSATAALTSLRSSCHTPASLGGSGSEDGRPESKRKCSGAPIFEAKRGRCHHWKTVHLERGACSVCHVCGKSPQTLRLTHPMSWHANLSEDAIRVGLDLTSCVCYPCHDLLRYRQIEPGDLAIPVAAQSSSSSHSAASSRPLECDSPTSMFTNSCIPYDSPRKSSSSSPDASDEGDADDQCKQFSSRPPSATQSDPNECHLPGCHHTIYCDIQNASRSIVAGVFDVDEDRLYGSAASPLYLCVNHYHACERKLRVVRCMYCNTVPPTSSLRSMCDNVNRMEVMLLSVGKQIKFPRKAVICDGCFYKKSQLLPQPGTKGVCSVETCCL